VINFAALKVAFNMYRSINCTSAFYKSLKDVSSVLLYVPFVLILMIIFTTIDSTPSKFNYQHNTKCEVLSEDNHQTGYNIYPLLRGEGNTSEGYRIDSKLIEYNVRTPDSLTFKTIAIRDYFTLQTTHFGYFCIVHSNCINADFDSPVFFHQLLI